jgi:hypothetical protein
MTNSVHRVPGGRGGIRTLGTVAGSLVFKTSALDHYATLPLTEAIILMNRLFPKLDLGKV